nr:hypothetical protein [Tanacetum cinerariifolium]
MASFDYRLNPLYPIKECSSCGALYTTDYCCSDGSLGHRIICDLDKTPDLSQRPPQNFLSVETRLMVNIVKDVLFSEINLKKICLHIVMKMEFSKILPSHPMTIPMLLMLFKSHSLSIKTPEEEKQIEEEQVARYWKIPSCYDDDDDEYTIAITHKEPDDSLSMGYEHLDTILATKSNEFIKSSVENLVSNAIESEEIYPNPLFDEEIISIKMDPHHFNAESDLVKSLFNRDSPIISSSSKIDSLFDEFVGELTLYKSIPSGINETDYDPEEETRFIKRFLYDNSFPRPPKEFISENSDAAFESFSSFPIPVDRFFKGRKNTI